ncbi:MAG: PilZ domain-containing protein [Nitrospirae bacterium]|nr:MAG: PilZ domain-containing protein [Nitrospirota bacterium]
MLKINTYNIKRNENRIVFILVSLIVAILAINFSSLAQKLSWLNYFFIALWIYLLILQQKLKKTAYAEELRQFKLSMESNKRKYQRYAVGRGDKIRVFFTVVKYLWVFELKKKRFAKVIDISEGGLLVQTDTKDIAEGDKASAVTIEFPQAGTVKADALFVRVTSDRCALSFVNPTNASRNIIKKYILLNSLELSDGKG